MLAVMGPRSARAESTHDVSQTSEFRATGPRAEAPCSKSARSVPNLATSNVPSVRPKPEDCRVRDTMPPATRGLYARDAVLIAISVSLSAIVSVITL